MLKDKILNYLQENDIENSDEVIDIYQIYSDIYSEFIEFHWMFIDFAWQEDHYIMAWITTDWWDTLYYDVDVKNDFDNKDFYNQIANECICLYELWKAKQIEYSQYIIAISRIVGRVNGDNQIFYDIIMDFDIDDDLDWSIWLYRYILDCIQSNHNNQWLLDTIYCIDSTKLNKYLLDYINK